MFHVKHCFKERGAMFLNHIHISQFRNLQSVELSLPEHGYCIISGPNGSGKTSILEAIYALSCGKSFRTSDATQLIQNDAVNFVLFAKLSSKSKTLELFPNVPQGTSLRAQRGNPSEKKIGLGWIASSTRNDGNKGLERTLLLEDTLANVGASGGRPVQTQIADQIGRVPLAPRGQWQDSVTPQSSSISVGVQRDRSGKIIAKCAGESAKFSEIARMLPARVISPIESYTLINGGPEQRRRFLDWGMFHVKHFYWNELQKLNRILKQKNAALKMRCSDEELDQWNHMLAEVSYSLDSMRQEYIQKLVPIFSKYQQNLPSIKQVNLTYFPGWDNLPTDLFTQLSTVSRQERQQGYCVLGPHRAEILLRTPNGLCKDQLSRGRQKTLAIALYLAQGELLFNETGRHPLYMIDDFSSELDAEAQQLLMGALDPSDKQVIITNLEKNDLVLDHVYSGAYHTKRYFINKGKLQLID